jgi:ribonuclease HI
MDCTIYVDGGARGNPGPAGAGVVITDTHNGALLHEGGYFLGRATNNVAEYRGLLQGLQLASQLGATAVQIVSDSELMVKQLNGEYRVKSPDLKPLYDQVRQFLQPLKSWTIRHVRREQNKRADELANQAMDAKRAVSASPSAAPSGKDRATGTPTPSAAPGTAAPAETAAPTLPCFTATVEGSARRCLAGTGVGNEYTFGPTTPEGFCLHAAAAVLADGPLQWPASKRLGQTRCHACGQTIKLRRML